MPHGCKSVYDMVKFKDSYLKIADSIPGMSNLSVEEKRARIEAILSNSFLDLTNDFAFKLVFGHHLDILLALLNALLPEHISSIENLPNEVKLIQPIDRKVFFDVICKTKDGRQIIVEMQGANKDDLKNRMFYYGAKLLGSQIERGASSYSLLPVYVICMMNFSYHKASFNPEQFLFIYRFREDRTNELFGNQLTFYAIELPRVRSPKESPVTNWLYFIKNMHTFASKPAGISGEVEQMFELSRTVGLTEQELEEYLKNMLTKEREESIAKANYDVGRLDGIDEGFEKGLAEGVEKGLAEGVEKGRREIIQAMHAQGIDVEQIAILTGIAPDEVARISAGQTNQ